MQKRQRRRLKEAAIRAFFSACGLLAVLVLAGIFVTPAPPGLTPAVVDQ